MRHPRRSAQLPDSIEQYYSPQAIAERISKSDDFVRDYFRDDPNVLVIHHPKTLNKRGYTSMMIPLSSVLKLIDDLKRKK
jgi:hypothetical protein